MVHNETKEIELELRDKLYTIELSTKTFGTFFGEDIFLRITKLLTKLLGASGGIELEGMNLKGIDIEFVCNSLYQNLNENEIKNLIKDVCSNTSIQYIYDDDRNSEFSSDIYNLQSKKDFDAAFSGKLSVLYDVIKFVLEVNYSDFLARLNFSKMGGKFKEAMGKVKAVKEAAKSGAIKLSGAKK